MSEKLWKDIFKYLVVFKVCLSAIFVSWKNSICPDSLAEILIAWKL